MSVQTADEVIDTFMLKLLVEGLVDITAVIALFAALFITWRVLRSHRLANLDGLNRIGKGMGFLFLSMLLTGLLEVVDVALVLFPDGPEPEQAA